MLKVKSNKLYSQSVYIFLNMFEALATHWYSFHKSRKCFSTLVGIMVYVYDQGLIHDLTLQWSIKRWSYGCKRNEKREFRCFEQSCYFRQDELRVSRLIIYPYHVHFEDINWNNVELRPTITAIKCLRSSIYACLICITSRYLIT